MAHVIDCRDCGDERTTLYRNTRYCMSCRLLRDLAWLEAVERKCRSNSCDAAFLPVSKKDLFCGPCAGLMVAEHGPCLFCRSDPAPLHRGMSICTTCVRDAGERARVLGGLRNGQAARTARPADHNIKAL